MMKAIRKLLNKKALGAGGGAAEIIGTVLVVLLLLDA